MTRNFILSLPREVRHQIYIDVLSPTRYLCALKHNATLGHFALVPFTPPDCLEFGRVRLSLLQTCKQINLEARDILYAHNTWAFLNVRDLSWLFQELDVGLRYRVRHIWLGVDLMSRGSLGETTTALNILSVWARQAGDLRTVSLGVVNRGGGIVELMELRSFGPPPMIETANNDPTVRDSLFNKFLAVFRDSWGKYDGQWGGVKRKLELGVGCLTGEALCEPRETIKEMHEAFGGELWIDGRLCYQDGVKHVEPFERDFRGEWQIAWFREGDNFYWGNRDG